MSVEDANVTVSDATLGGATLRNAAAHDAAERFVHLRAPRLRPGVRSTLRDSDLQLAVYQVEG